jgi:hypothetical protein
MFPWLKSKTTGRFILQSVPVAGCCEAGDFFARPNNVGVSLVNSTLFVTTSISSAFCHTCVHWGGARVIKKGHVNSWSNFIGGCNISSGEDKQSAPKVLKKLATEPGCENWLTMQSN